MSQLKEMPGSVTIKCTFSGCHNQKNCQGMPKFKSIPRKSSNQKYCQEVSQVKVQPGSAIIIRTARECHKQNASIISTYSDVAIKNTSMEFTLKSTDRECHNLKYCQRLSHENVLPRSATIQNTPRECQNQIYCQGVQQAKMAARKCHNLRTTKEDHDK